MNSLLRNYVFTVLQLLVAVPVLASEFPVPEGSTTTWVASDIKQNGLPMQILQIKSMLTAEAVLDFYRYEWASGRNGIPGYVESSVGDWKVISHLDGTHNMVVQMRASGLGGSQGFLSAIELDAVSDAHASSDAFPSLAGSEPISVTDSTDQDKAATTYILMNTFSVSSNTSFYQAKMSSKGWTLLHTVSKENIELLLFNQSGKSLDIAITQSVGGSTVVFANFVSDES